MTNKIYWVMCVACLFTMTIAQAQTTAGAGATINGTPYINETYEEGVIYTDGKVFKIPARYNAYKDVIEYQQNGRAMMLDPSASIKKVRLPNADFVVEKYELNGKSKLGFLTLLDSGKVMLYSKKSINYIPFRKGGKLDGSDQPAEFKKLADVFYYKVGENDLVEVKNIKTMIAEFPDKQDELTRFAKKEKISPRNEEELVKLIKYYNSL